MGGKNENKRVASLESVPIPLKLIFICFIFFSLAVNLGSAVQLTRDSYMYYIDTDYETSNKTYTKLSVSFKTTELNGLLIWNGQVFTVLILLKGLLHCFFTFSRNIPN